MSTKTSLKLLVLTIILTVASMLSTCSTQDVAEPRAYHLATRIALDWNRLLLELEWHTPGYRPPVTARMFAYAEMAAYEASLPAMNGYISLEKYCPGYQALTQSPSGFYLPSALNAAYAHIARAFFPTAPAVFFQKIDQLERLHQQSMLEDADLASLQQSIDFGRKTAAAVWQYSMQDSVGHDGFLYNFDRTFKAKDGVGCWKSDGERPMPALLPNWGNVRTFVVGTKDVVVTPPVPFDEAAPSEYFSQALEIYSISKSLSSESHWIAEFWSDDVPGLTISPTGRWISIATQAMETSNLRFPEVMETYLKTGMALCDAAIICWESKYVYQTERPETFIQNNIQVDWKPFHSSPSFPGYPSGHAIFGAAAAQTLSAALGNSFPLVDRTHEGRKEFNGKARPFNSFDEMANENAYSRVLMGVHFRMDCEEGLRLGKLIGQRVAALSLRKDKVAELRNR